MENVMLIIAFVAGSYSLFTLGRLYESVIETRKFLTEMETKMKNREMSHK